MKLKQIALGEGRKKGRKTKMEGGRGERKRREGEDRGEGKRRGGKENCKKMFLTVPQKPKPNGKNI